MFDITKKRATETATIPLKEADGTPMRGDKKEPLTVTVYGPGSKAWADGQVELGRRRTERVKEADGNLTAALKRGKKRQRFPRNVNARFLKSECLGSRVARTDTLA